jgi:endonuclease/exonuclease/phosphatase family metal-dependent hydrolase
MELELVTWNTDGLDSRGLDPRAEALCLEVLFRPRHPDVVCLQEVVPRTFLAHFGPHFGHAGYRPFPAKPPESVNYYDLVLVKAPLELVGGTREPFQTSQMGRALTSVIARSGTEELAVMTSHLESLREGSVERRLQVAEVARRLAHSERPILYAGDTNLRDSELEALPDTPLDAWLLAGSPAATRYTWDAKVNPNIRSRGGTGSGPRSMRFDRVFLGGPVGWHVRSFTLLGKTAVEGTEGLWPSDHQGVLVGLEAR